MRWRGLETQIACPRIGCSLSFREKAECLRSLQHSIQSNIELGGLDVKQLDFITLLPRVGIPRMEKNGKTPDLVVKFDMDWYSTDILGYPSFLSRASGLTVASERLLASLSYKTCILSSKLLICVAILR